MAQEQQQVLAFDEQLTGLSPTVCRRAIAAIREEAERLMAADSNREPSWDWEPKPGWVRALIRLLEKQTCVSTNDYGEGNVEKVRNFLNGCERFLDVVEGVEGKESSSEPIPPP